jgi:hypothetical protein
MLKGDGEVWRLLQYGNASTKHPDYQSKRQSQASRLMTVAHHPEALRELAALQRLA